MATNITKFLLPLILLVLAFKAKPSNAFTGMCVCTRVNTTAARWSPFSHRFVYGTHLRKGECFKSLWTASAYVFALGENGGELIIPTVDLESMKCPHKQEDTVLRFNPYCPSIRNRTEWKARDATSKTKLNVPVKYFIVHHSATGSCFTTEYCDRLVRSIQKFHMDTRHFADIGYNFLIGGNGVVYEGRGWSIEGAHAKGYNSRSIGICMLGNFENKKPTAEAMNSLKQMINCSFRKGQISENYILAGHRNLGTTDCPGTALYNIIKKWPHFIKK